MIKDTIEKMREDLRVSNARVKLINMQRLKSSLESFTDMEISNMFNLPMHKRSSSIVTLDRLIAEQERHINWLINPKKKLVTTPEQDVDIEKMYYRQRKESDLLDMLPFTMD
jgi:hypothetical protein